jgi:short-subunit dehydrogenase
MAMPFLGVNSASKFALEAFSDALRMELQPWNIPVSIIEPSYINTGYSRDTCKNIK